MKKILFWMFSLVAATLISCRPQEPNFLDVKLASGEDITASLKFEGKAEPCAVVVDAGMKWFTKIDAEDNWLKIEPAAGLPGKTEAVITINDKIDDGARRAKIQFMMIGSAMVKEIEIMQKGGYDFIQLTDPEGKELVSPVEVGDKEITVPFVVNSGRRWTVKAVQGGSWLKVKPDRGMSGETKVELTVAKNAIEKAREGKLHFSLVGGKNMTYDFEITQKAHVKEEAKPLDEKDVLLDVEFAADGSAKDASMYAMKVEHIPGPTHMNYYNEMYKRNAAHFSAAPGSILGSGYYKVDYSSNNEFMNKLKDGHSIEILFATHSPLEGTKEVKPFTSHQAGGTGIETKAGKITFLPNIKGWKFVESNVVAQPGRYYHAIGVWNKEEGRSYIYVDGEKKGELATPGDLTLSTIKWFGIGCDSGSKGEAAWNGDIVLARIYDTPLSAENVKMLYEKVKVEQSGSILLTDLEYLPTCTVAAGNKYHIYGKGFKAGDKICFDPLAEGESNIEVEGDVKDGQIIVTIPSTLKSGRYNLTLKRGTSIFPIGNARFTIGSASSEPFKTQVVAHRCYQKYHKQNTLAAFIDTEELGVWGAEIDVHITKDKKVVVDHNGKFQGVWDDDHNFCNYTWAEIHAAHPDLSLLDEFLEAMTDGRVNKLNMVLEIKGQPTTPLNNELVDLCAELINKHEAKHPGLTKRIAWISFWTDICERALKHIPDAMTMYLGNPPTDPKYCFDKGIMGIDYNGGKMTDEWIQQAHELGMVVNVWTINSTPEMVDFIGRGVDFITTDKPDVLKDLLKKDFVTK